MTYRDLTFVEASKLFDGGGASAVGGIPSHLSPLDVNPLFTVDDFWPKSKNRSDLPQKNLCKSNDGLPPSLTGDPPIVYSPPPPELAAGWKPYPLTYSEVTKLHPYPLSWSQPPSQTSNKQSIKINYSSTSKAYYYIRAILQKYKPESISSEQDKHSNKDVENVVTEITKYITSLFNKANK